MPPPAIDTATEACSAALYLDGAIVARYALAPREHERLILPKEEELLRVVEGIAYGADLPVVPVSSLAALAQGCYRERGVTRVLATIDARIGEVYWGMYELGEGVAELRGEERVMTPHSVPLPEGEGWYGAGSGWAAYGDILQSRLQDLVSHVE